MMYVIAQFAPWILIGAFGLGVLIGLGTWAQKPRGLWLSGWMKWAAILFVIGLFSAVFKLLAGRAGLWLETALIMFAAYIVGCQLGSWARSLFAAPVPALSGIAGAAPYARSASADAMGAGSPASAFPSAPAGAPLAIDSSSAYPGKRPPGLAAPDGAPDDLTQISGIEAIDQKMLGDLGIHHARQIAKWSPDHAAWIDHHMAMPGRVEAEQWIAKAAAFPSQTANAAAAGARGGAQEAAAEAATKAAAAAASAATAAAATAASTAQAAAGNAVSSAKASADSAANAVSSKADTAAAGVASPASPAAAAATMLAAANAGSVATSATPQPGDVRGAHPGSRPGGVTGDDVADDDLRRIRGISPGDEAKLNRVGIRRYGQIAAWGQNEIDWTNSYLGAPGRIERDGWVEQARFLATAQKNQTNAADSSAAPAGGGSSSGSARGGSGGGTPVGGASSPAAAAASASAMPATMHAATVSAASPAPAAGAVAAIAGDADAAHPGVRPDALAAPRAGAADDLKWIKGVGPKNEQALHGIGVYHFNQIAAWTPDNAKWAGSYMAFPGRIEREDWIGQCRLLASGQQTDHARRVAAGEFDPAHQDHEDAHPGVKPAGLAGARQGKADDLKRIKGIGPQNEQKLNALGIFHFDQVASWNADEVNWVGSYMAFPGRIEREDWIGQAKQLARGEATEFSRRVDAGEVPTSAGGAAAAAMGAVAAIAAGAVAGADVPVAADLGDIDAKHPGKRPAGLPRPRGDEPDDLLKIKGVGKANLHQLHALGIFHFDQIAKWTKDELRWVGSYMAFPGRLDKEDWIGQAKHFAKRREIELANRAATHRE